MSCRWSCADNVPLPFPLLLLLLLLLLPLLPVSL